MAQLRAPHISHTKLSINRFKIHMKPTNLKIHVEEYDADLDHSENASKKYKVDIDPYYGVVSRVDFLYHPNTDEYLGIKSDGSDREPDEEDREGSEEEDKEGPEEEDKVGGHGSNISGLTGTVTKIETDEMVRFERFFVAIGCAIRSFMNHLPPLIVIDDAHLKGPYLGACPGDHPTGP
ncbi:hypothetical protein L6452_40540 [Arctium lappa]|uniref:Uncharacterized protein n=1 Tax=Arctium lappa TaxID=4217 RepID=A0ACB8XLN6_ARCLA|nr:hypothetical protein L6452_40540 [Arctium lappa]